MVETMVQPDLFGETEVTETAAQAVVDRAAEWRATVMGPLAPWPHDTSTGNRQGEPCQTWRCPGCGMLELTEYTLGTNHGPTAYSPAPWCGRRDQPYGWRLVDGVLAHSRSEAL